MRTAVAFRGGVDAGYLTVYTRSVKQPPILLVEDEPAIADNLVYALESDGFVVEWVQTGGAALARAAATQPIFVILDIGLPDMSGFDVCRQLRAGSAVPILFLTARADEIDRVAGLEMGADDYVSKPFSPREICARVRAILRRGRGASMATTHAEAGTSTAAFEVDEQCMRIAYGGTWLDLSRYEYRILKILIGHPGWVFSRDRLMELAWEEPEASLSRTVDAHIKTLRAKLRAVRGDTSPIRTHRGEGYSLQGAETT